MQSEKKLETVEQICQQVSPITNQEIIEAAAKSKTISESLKYLNLCSRSGHNFRWFVSKTKELNIDISHFKSYKTIIQKNKRLVLQDLLIENSTFLDTVKLKNKLYAAKMLEAKCSECGITDWCGKPISLHLDHINGLPNDNRIENLRILCPNCHWQIGKKNVQNKIGRKKLIDMKKK